MAYLYRGGPQSPRDDAAVLVNPLSPPTRASNRVSPGVMPAVTSNVNASSEARVGLQRRFTTNALPTLSPLGLQRKQAMGDYTNMSYARKQPSETAVRRYETLLAAQRELQKELDKIDPETRREVEEGLRHEESVTQMMASSEPTSPPEYGGAFPSAFSRPNRFSMTSLTSPPGIATRPNRASTQLTSPPITLARPYTSGNVSALPSQSVPGSRRHSDDEDEGETMYGYEGTQHRAAANPNRNSMPITSYDRKRNVDFPSLTAVNTTGFLFEEEGDVVSNKISGHRSKPSATSPPDMKTFLQVQHTPDGFPKLIRREDNIDLSSVALEVALSQGVEPQTQQTDRLTSARNRISLPAHALSNTPGINQLTSILAGAESQHPGDRRSLEVKFTAEAKRPAMFASPPRGLAPGALPRAQASYSTNDIPTLSTLKSLNGELKDNNYNLTSPVSQPSQMVDPISPQHKVYTSPRNSITRQSQDFTAITSQEDLGKGMFATAPASALQANAMPFGPSTGLLDNPGVFNQVSMNSPYAQAPFFGGYNMGALMNGFAGMSFNGGFGAAPNQWQAPMASAYAPTGFNGYQSMHHQQQTPNNAAPRFGDNAHINNGGRNMSVAQKRQAHEEALAKFNSVDIADLVGEIYTLCKDQHGCRFLQRKLDERDDQVIGIIFDDIKLHIIELMTDPFGNYLCQKLLECASDDQRTTLIQNAMPAMTKIALNQHGTRALQKMIEYISTPQQTQMIIQALRHDVVQLIQDLNGNHVIQKCLNHLTPIDAQFIFEAVGANCVTVGTHRHGCCVLQRCIDHASGVQKGTLVDQVIANAFALVQDPFGNYVVQYILDLSEPSFTEPLCKSFLGNVVFLSKQKFSSNVIEKCIRCAGADSKRMLIEEINVPAELDKLLRDSFANYVVQTAMDYGDEVTKAALVENVRPIVPAIRHTPYGRRIQSKLQDYDNRKGSIMPTNGGRSASGAVGGILTPPDSTKVTPINNGISFAGQNAPTGRGNRQGFIGPPGNYNGSTNSHNFMPLMPGPDGVGVNYGGPNGYHSNEAQNGRSIASPTPQRQNLSNAVLSNQNNYKVGHTDNNNTLYNYGMDRQGPHYNQF